MKQGRPLGYQTSQDTRDKIRQARLGTSRCPETKQKIGKSVRESLTNTKKSPQHRDNIANSLFDLEKKCARRFEEMKADYPGQEEFFDANRHELLPAMEDCKSEKELTDLRRYVEISQIESTFGYEYSSSSIYAAEEVIITLLDAKRLLELSVNPVTIQ